MWRFGIQASDSLLEVVGISEELNLVSWKWKCNVPVLLVLRNFNAPHTYSVD